MTTKLQKTIAITCLVSLIIASVAVAADQQDNRQNSRARSRQGQGGGYRGERATDQGRGGYGARGIRPGRGMQGLIPDMIRRRLNLTEEQDKKLQAVQQQQMEKNQVLSKQHVSLRNKLEAAVNKGDKEAIVKISQEIGKNIGDTALLKLSGKDSLKEILNEDQLKKVEKFNKQMAERREKMRKQMQQRMDGKAQGTKRSRRQNQDKGRGRDQDQDRGRLKRSR